MGAGDSDRKTTYTAAVRVAAERDLGYLHLVEPTIAGSMSVEAAADAIPTSYFRSIYPGTLIVSGDHTPQTGHEAIRSGAADLVGFGRAFISNPDLPWRIASGAELAPSNRATYYTDGDEGYHDYPSLEEQAFADALQMAEMEGAVDVARAGRALRESQAEWLIASGEWYASQRLIAAQGQQG